MKERGKKNNIKHIFSANNLFKAMETPLRRSSLFQCDTFLFSVILLFLSYLKTFTLTFNNAYKIVLLLSLGYDLSKAIFKRGFKRLVLFDINIELTGFKDYNQF